MDGWGQEAFPIVGFTLGWLAAVHQAVAAKQHVRDTAHVLECCHPPVATADLCQRVDCLTEYH